MAYGVLLGQRPKSGLGAKVYLTAYQNTSSLTNVTATGQNTGKTYTATYNTTAQAFIFSIDVYDTYTFSGVLDGNTLTQTAVVNASKKIDVVLPPVLSSTLNDNSWAAIRYAADNNLGESIWAVGDAKQITINATIGTKSYSNYQPWVYILGFNHNATYEGNNTIHFGCFQSTQTYSVNGGIALDDSNYGSKTSTTLAFHMNTTDTNSGGWQSSIMRQQVLDSDASSATSGSSNSFLAALPSDLQAVLKQCTKYTDNTGQSSAQSAVTATQDWVFLLSEYEVQGRITNANTYEQKYQQQYQYYANGNSKVKYRQSATGIAAWWWNRSPHASRSSNFCIVSSDGSANNNGASRSYGLAPGFCV